MRFFPAVLLLVFCLPLTAHNGDIPLLISDHHADHLDFFLRHGADSSSVLLVLDSHADTTANEDRNLIGNHNWIHPLGPQTIVWISVIRGLHRGDKLLGFYKSIAEWGREVEAFSMSLEELRFMDINLKEREKKLFISVDLDFFYSENQGPDDIPHVLDSLFEFSSSWTVPVVWAFSLSRPWLPNDAYAWTLLEKSLVWLKTRPEFGAPQVTLFINNFFDTSLNARAFRNEGLEIPALREEDMPETVRDLLSAD